MGTKTTESESKIYRKLTEKADAAIKAYLAPDSAGTILYVTLDEIGHLLNDLGIGACTRKGFRIGWGNDEEGDDIVQIEMPDDSVNLDVYNFSTTYGT